MHTPGAANDSKSMPAENSGSADAQKASKAPLGDGSGSPQQQGQASQMHAEISTHAHTISHAVALSVIDDISDVSGQGATNGSAKNSSKSPPAIVDEQSETGRASSKAVRSSAEVDVAAATPTGAGTAAGSQSDRANASSPQNAGTEGTSADSYAAADADKQLGEGAEELPTNPGSIGHPELCPRPCLYYPIGQCANGANCNFCHMLHPKRPAHLDKRHRVMLKEMSFSDCVVLMMPILRSKVQALQCDEEATSWLDTLQAAASSGGAASQGGASAGSRTGTASGRSGGGNSSGIHALQTAMGAMSLRSLLAMLHRAALPEVSAERAAIDGLMQHLCCQDRGSGDAS